MKRILSLVLSVLLCSVCLAAFADGFDGEAFAEKFANQSLQLEPVTLPGLPEEVAWLSASPSGRYLIGLCSEALLLYDRQQQCCAPVQFDLSGDVNGKLQWLLGNPRYLFDFTFVWSPDEQYFTACNWEMVVQNGMLRGDLLLGGTKTATVSVKRSWGGSRISEEDCGAVYDACFSPDSRMLYFSFVGNAYEYFDGRFMTLAYDIAADTITPVAANSSGYQEDVLQALYCGMSCLADGSIVQLVQARQSQHWQLRRLLPARDGWSESLLPMPADCYGVHNMFATSDASGILVLTPNITMSQAAVSMGAASQAASVSAESKGYRQVVQFEAAVDGSMAALRQSDALNVCFSPDGRYYMTVSGSAADWVLQVYDAVTGEVCPVDVSTPALDFAYLVGRNPLAREFPAGMMWCGDLLLLGTEEGAALFRFAD